MRLVSIDIGSTWTKGAAFRASADGGLQLLDRASHPTTVENLSRGFDAVLRELVEDDESYDLYYSSSAKGGLAVAAVGIVPDITAEMAKITAYSSGAKLTHSFAYELGEDDIAALQRATPDIILLAGGSDGGNAYYQVQNARKLAGAGLSCTIVYAGNRHVRENVRAILDGHDLICVDNLLPALDFPNPEPARAAVRDVFLSKITSGKGLDRIIRSTGREPCPTPYALYEYCSHIARHAPEFGDFLLVDMGGATTDVYSCHDEVVVAGVVRRGLPEPKIKRTVEGDLGMRVSASTAAEAVLSLMPPAEDRLAAFESFVSKVTATPEIVPVEPEEIRFDAMLAGANIATSLMRHAGRAHEVSTADGLVTVQVGRDLTSVRTLIGTGGYLSSAPEFDPRDHVARIGLDARGKRVLVPRCKEYLRDPANLLPLLANIARGHPVAAVTAGLRLLGHEASDENSIVRSKIATT
ncbi:glutamate mutase L [Ensifer sp. BR816]|uniref:glutamate mutase L n=1 Tax=Rhizobium sp. (strain BR816) TaxID=1057002 RepID=UPI00037F9086|nr:glutamate mutase L [Ensifer sp. BR816]